MWLRFIKRCVIFVTVLYTLWLGIGCAIQRRMMFPREYAKPIANAGEGIEGLEQVWIDSPEGKVEAWFIPAIRATPQRGEPGESNEPAPAVIFAHGNAELIDNNATALLPYRFRGISVLLVEFRGYGRSAGSPSQEAITNDYIKAYDWLVARSDVDSKKIIFHGRSLGGGVVCSLANHRTPAAIILQSTFISAKKMAAKFGMPGFIVKDPFDNEAALQNLTCPKLIFHGKRDSVIPFSHGEHLAAIDKAATFIAYDCNHNDFPPNEAVYWRDLRTFLVEYGFVKSPDSSK